MKNSDLKIVSIAHIPMFFFWMYLQEKDQSFWTDHILSGGTSFSVDKLYKY